VDNLHSQIDRHLKLTELYSPLGVIRLLLSVNSKNPLRVIQMSAGQFFDYKSAAKQYDFIRVPYQRVKAIAYKKTELCHVQIKTSFDTSEDFIAVPVKKSCHLHTSASSGKCQGQHHALHLCKTARNNNWLSADKKKDIESMYPFMPSVDKQFMETIMKCSQSSLHDRCDASTSATTHAPAKDKVSKTAGGADVNVSQKPKCQQVKTRRSSRISPPETSVNTGTEQRRSGRKKAHDKVTELPQSKRRRLR